MRPKTFYAVYAGLNFFLAASSALAALCLAAQGAAPECVGFVVGAVIYVLFGLSDLSGAMADG